MIVWGGSGASGHLNTGARYKPQPEGWTATSTGTGVPSARYLHTAVWAGSEMIVWGGFSGAGYVGTGGRYAPSTNAWTATPTGGAAPTARGYHTAVWTGSEMIVWGGYYFDGADHELDTGGRFSPSTGAWLPTAAWSDRRALHTTVWTGSELIAWGGQRLVPPAAAVSLNSGVRYTPATDSWTETSTGANTPAARLYHSAVWTGTEMIVWGGYNPPATEFGNGGRYNPTSNSWTALPAGGGAPSARDTHTAVWTGSEMIVWGGWDGLNAFGSGGRFKPAGASWTATPAGPDARYAHSAVWTGTEMIVWGGESIASGAPASRLNSGARFTPASGQWSATPLGATTPEPRSWHTAVWTGSSMIVWGGLDGTVAYKTGGRYTPGSASWSATDAGLKAPAARAFHSAVWTGSDMIVWGGSDSTGPATLLYASGGRYSPATNNWVPTSTTAAPTARDGHGAAWTGTEMLVFGGRDAASTLSTGGRYCAAPCTAPAPSGIPRLSVTASGVAATIAWTPVAGASSYDLVRGALGALHDSRGNFSAATGTCLAANIAGTSAPDATVPAPGDGFWYLSRGSSCGGDGTYDSGAPSQAGGRDAEIALSPNACP